jgi:hypothetical protein
VADAPWRCSQCGTVNEPNANACRSCGRWPSLFDLERSTLDVEEDDAFEQTSSRPAPALEVYDAPVEAPEPDEVEQDYSGVPEETSKPAKWPGLEDPLDRPTQGWPKLASWIVPIVFLVYVLISIITNR